MLGVGCKDINEEHHGYSNADAVLYVVHDLEYGIIGLFIPDLGVLR